MGQDELAVSDEAEFFFPMDALKKKLVVMVIAIDADGLESSVSGILKVRKPK